jgi:hypothetical protein
MCLVASKRKSSFNHDQVPLTRHLIASNLLHNLIFGPA